MKLFRRRWILPATLAGVMAVCISMWFAFTRPPVAIIQVVDTAGQPIAGVTLKPGGMRPKPGPYAGGWYGWRTGDGSVPNPPVQTGNAGTAAIPYPRYVFERIETGVLCLAADHPDYIPERPECIVSTSPPAGAPWQVVANYWWQRMSFSGVNAPAAPVTLKKGAALRLTVRPEAAGPTNATLLAQLAPLDSLDTNSWSRPAPDTLITRRLPTTAFIMRAIKVETNGAVWFSEVISNTAGAGTVLKLEVSFQRGATVRGTLDATVPRPVRNGRVIAHVWPTGYRAEDSPPEWHGWSPVREDGGFEIVFLPPGDLEIVALCDGFVSTNGPGQFKLRYPQKHTLGAEGFTTTVGMEPTARLVVEVRDDKGKPLKGAQVSTWPNVRYGEWSATILASDCYNSSDWFLLGRPAKRGWGQSVPDFEGTTDDDGLAVLANLPSDVKEFSVQHPKFLLPAVTLPGWTRKERRAVINLTPGTTNRASVQLEPAGSSPVAHY